MRLYYWLNTLLLAACVATLFWMLDQGLEYREARKRHMNADERKHLTSQLNICTGQLHAVARGDDEMVRRLRSMGDFR